MAVGRAMAKYEYFKWPIIFLLAVFVVATFFNLVILLGNIFYLRTGIDISAEGLANADWFIVLATIFGGVISAATIFIAFRQANNLHLETKIYMNKEKRYERKMREFNEIKNCIVDINVRTCNLNVMDKFVKEPTSEEDVLRRKEAMYSLYNFTEESYNKVFALGLFFNDISAEDKGKLAQEEVLFYAKRLELSDTYRELYNLLHDYLNFYLNGLEVCYKINSLWIWELRRTLKSPVPKTDIEERASDPSKAWTMLHGKKVNIEPDTNGLPAVGNAASELIHNSNLLSMLQGNIAKAIKEEQLLIEKLNSLVVELRIKLVNFVAVAEDLEMHILQGDIMPSPVSLQKQVEMFMAKKPA